jgi:hypothetical protein
MPQDDPVQAGRITHIQGRLFLLSLFAARFLSGALPVSVEFVLGHYLSSLVQKYRADNGSIYFPLSNPGGIRY